MLAVRKYTKLVRKGNTTAKEIASSLVNDPMMASKIVCRANGAHDNLEEAIAQLGVSQVLAMLSATSSYQLASSRDVGIQQSSENLWKHSFAVALIARDLTTILGKEEGEGCFWGGLLHDIGKLTVATLLLEAEKSITSSAHQKWVSHEVWQEVVKSSYRSVEKAISDKWKLPPAARGLLQDGTEYDIGQRDCNANIVRFANALVESGDFKDGFTDPSEASALVMVGKSILSVDDDLLQNLTQNLLSRVDEHF